MSKHWDEQLKRVEETHELREAYEKGDSDVVRYQTGSKTHAVGPDGGVNRPTYGYERKEDPKKESNNTQQAAPTPPPEETPKPENDLVIKRSPEIQQAKSRVSNYENNSSSGFTSNSIYSSSTNEPTPAKAPAKDPQMFSDRYKLDLANSMKQHTDSFDLSNQQNSVPRYNS